VVIEAIFVTTGVPNLLLRPYAVAMDKRTNLNINTVQILLGLPWNMCDMTVGTTLQCRLETVHLLHTVWHEGREFFTIGEVESLIGKIGRIGQGSCPVFHLIPMLYASSSFALRAHNKFLISTSSGFTKPTKRVKHKPEIEDGNNEIMFAVVQAVRQAPSCKT
jgi:hypothetical protein